MKTKRYKGYKYAISPELQHGLKKHHDIDAEKEIKKMLDNTRRNDTILK